MKLKRPNYEIFDNDFYKLYIKIWLMEIKSPEVKYILEPLEYFSSYESIVQKCLNVDFNKEIIEFIEDTSFRISGLTNDAWSSLGPKISEGVYKKKLIDHLKFAHLKDLSEAQINSLKCIDSRLNCRLIVENEIFRYCFRAFEEYLEKIFNKLIRSADDLRRGNEMDKIFTKATNNAAKYPKPNDKKRVYEKAMSNANEIFISKSKDNATPLSKIFINMDQYEKFINKLIKLGWIDKKFYWNKDYYKYLSGTLQFIIDNSILNTGTRSNICNAYAKTFKLKGKSSKSIAESLRKPRKGGAIKIFISQNFSFLINGQM